MITPQDASRQFAARITKRAVNRIRPYGYGLEIDVEGTSVDFDFGINGEIDGFDGWRLSLFVEANQIETSLDTEEKIDAAIQQALSSGKIERGAGGNYYLISD